MTHQSVSSRGRDVSLDMVKGLLVIAMLLIHCGTLFLDSERLRHLIYPIALGFVSGSWLFMSGYLIGTLNSREPAGDPRSTTGRLVGRGVRLVLIFAASNIVLGRLTLHPGPWDDVVLGQLTGAFIYGSDQLAFEVLLGIGYLLMIAPALLATGTRGMAAAASAFIGLATVYGWLGIEWKLVPWMLCSGVAGAAVGSLCAEGGFGEFIADMGHRRCAVAVALSVWFVTLVGAVGELFRLTQPIVYLPHVASMLTLLYLLGQSVRRINVFRRPLALMAHYSLVAYMGQMAILHLLHAIAEKWLILKFYPVAFATALLVLLTALYLLDSLRHGLPAVDRAYRWLFG